MSKVFIAQELLALAYGYAVMSQLDGFFNIIFSVQGQDQMPKVR